MNAAEAQYLKGLDLLRHGNAEAAAAAFQQAVRLAPRVAVAHHMHGVALHKVGELEAADAAITRAITLDRRQADFLANRSAVRSGLRRSADAADDARAALALQPGHFAALCNLGLALTGAKHFAEAAEVLEQAVAINPASAEALGLLGDALRESGDSRASMRVFRRALALAPDDLITNQRIMFDLNYVDDASDAERATAMQRLHALLAQTVARTPHVPVPRDGERPLRLGFVSGDLREHSVSQFLLDLLPHLIARGLKLVAYQTKPRSDHVTERLRPYFELWRDISNTDDVAASQLVSGDKIDILVDLAGLTSGARPMLFAGRPAPLAVAWLGYSATTANPGIDYVLANDRVLPRSEERYFTERPLRLAGPHICFSRPAGEPPDPVPGRPFTFGSFNRLNKLSDRTVALWSRILAAAPDTRLLLKTSAVGSAQTYQETRGRFAVHGIAAERIVLIDRTPTRQAHLALYGEVDLALDTWPYSGTTTTMEALAMGVPVLALDSGHFISRVSASLLAAAGLDELIAADEQDYVARAIAAAAKRAPDRDERRRLREVVLASPLCDPETFSAGFVEAMRLVWREWCRSAAT